MAEKPGHKEKYDAADNSARCYDEALAALRAQQSTFDLASGGDWCED